MGYCLYCNKTDSEPGVFICKACRKKYNIKISGGKKNVRHIYKNG